MSSSPQNNISNTPEHHVGAIGTIFSFLIILAIIGGGIWGAYYFIKTKPEVKKKKPEASAPLVRIMTAEQGMKNVSIEAMGTVTSADSVSLRSRVSGEILSIAPEFEPGGILKKGDPLLKLDRTDYELVLKQQKAALEKMEADLAVEKGRYAVAGKDVELIDAELTEEEAILAKREPQYAASKAAVESARAAVSKAELDLIRTEITAPFSCVVNRRLVSSGDVVNTSTVLADLAGVDEFRVEVALPVDQLKWISIPRKNKEQGSDVLIMYPAAWGRGVSRKGAVTALSPSLTGSGRMVKLYVSVFDPLSLEQGNESVVQLILGSLVQVVIKGKTLENIVAVPRSAVHDGNTVWIAAKENTLEIRPVETVWVSRDTAYIAEGLQSGDRVITSDLAAPIQGMGIHPVTETGEELNGEREKKEKGSAQDAAVKNGTENGKGSDNE